jgi:hypothetical protein
MTARSKIGGRTMTIFNRLESGANRSDLNRHLSDGI